MAEKKDILRETDDEARGLARRLIREARYAAIAVSEAETGEPLASRVLTGTDIDGAPVILISALAPHMAALRKSPRASLLYGEVGKGDPLAHARITVRVDAEEVPRGSEPHSRIRWRFIARHPKAKLYVDFPDFAFFRLEPVTASLNGGFGKAYHLDREELLINSPASAELAEIEPSAVSHMNSDHSEAADLYAAAFCKSKKTGWIIIGIDAGGVDIAVGDEIRRIDFDQKIEEFGELKSKLAGLLADARKKNV